MYCAITCQYCHQSKPSHTAVNQHIRHSPRCYKAYTEDLAHLSTLKNPEHSLSDYQPTIAASFELGVDSDVEMGSYDDPIEFGNKKLPSPLPVQLPQQHTVELEEIEDKENPLKPARYQKAYPGLVAEVLGVGKTPFEKLWEEQAALGENEWAPFAGQEEWDLARWLMNNVGQNSIDEYLKLPIVSSQHTAIKKLSLPEMKD